MDWISAKDAIVAFSGASRDTLHIFGGIGLFALAALASPRRGRVAPPFSVVLAVVLTNEAIDLAHGGTLAASLHDMVSTLFLPALICLWRAVLCQWFPPARRRPGRGKAFVYHPAAIAHPYRKRRESRPCRAVRNPVPRKATPP